MADTPTELVYTKPSSFTLGDRTFARGDKVPVSLLRQHQPTYITITWLMNGTLLPADAVGSLWRQSGVSHPEAIAIVGTMPDHERHRIAEVAGEVHNEGRRRDDKGSPKDNDGEPVLAVPVSEARVKRTLKTEGDQPDIDLTELGNGAYAADLTGEPPEVDEDRSANVEVIEDDDEFTVVDEGDRSQSSRPVKPRRRTNRGR